MSDTQAPVPGWWPWAQQDQPEPDLRPEPDLDPQTDPEPEPEPTDLPPWGSVVDDDDDDEDEDEDLEDPEAQYLARRMAAAEAQAKAGWAGQDEDDDPDQADEFGHHDPYNAEDGAWPDDEDFDPDEFDWSPMGINYQGGNQTADQTGLDEAAWESAHSPQLDSRTCAQLAAHEDQLIRWAVVVRSDCPPDVLATLAADTSQAVRWGLLRNPACPPEALVHLSSCRDDTALMLVAQHANTPPEAIQQLIQSNSEPVLQTIMCRSDCPDDLRAEAIQHLAPSARMAMAVQQGLDPAIYQVLAREADLRPLVLGNPDCPAHLRALATLAGIGDLGTD